jgi:hypothetical protein
MALNGLAGWSAFSFLLVFGAATAWLLPSFDSCPTSTFSSLGSATAAAAIGAVFAFGLKYSSVWVQFVLALFGQLKKERGQV